MIRLDRFSSLCSQLQAQARHLSATLLLLSLLMTGCGDGTNDGKANNRVEGKVTYGSRLVEGTVVFVGADGKEVEGTINPDGTYVVNDPPKGEVQILVKGLGGAETQGPAPGAPPGGTELPGGVDDTAQMPVPPPPKYARKGNGLKFTVTEGVQTHNIELTK